MKTNNFMIIASHAESLLNFRGHFIEALIKRNILVHVVAPTLVKSSKTREILERKGVKVHLVSMQRSGVNPFLDLKTLFELYILIKKIKPSYVFSYTIKPVIYGSIAAFLARVPNRISLITGLGFTFVETPSRNIMQYAIRVLSTYLYRVGLFCSNKVFFQNPDDEKLCRKSRILQKNTPSVVVNGSGVDLEKFSESPLPNKLSFLLVSRLLVSKGIREYASAAEKIKEKYPDISFVLVGGYDNPFDSISSEELKSWTDSNTLRYLGKLEDVRPAISNCSIFVLPSYYREGTPRSVLEAMAMGRPIITTNSPGCRETVKNEVNGFLVSPHSVDDIVHSMERFITQPELTMEMGKSSRKLAEEKYDVHKVNSVILAELGI